LRKLSNVLLCLAFTLLLGGCATTTKQPTVSAAPAAVYEQHLASIADINQFDIKGRIGVIVIDKGFSGRIHWQHQQNSDQAEVFSPLGGKVASINKTSEKVTLTQSDGKVFEAQDVETLTETTLGWRLPLDGLSFWALGKPATSQVEDAVWDELGRLISLKQDGWDIQYAKYTDSNGYRLPKLIKLRNEKIRLKLLVEEWLNVGQH